MSDPLGLTHEQRMESNLFALFRRLEMWWPANVDEAVGSLAETLRDLDVELSAKERHEP